MEDARDAWSRLADVVSDATQSLHQARQGVSRSRGARKRIKESEKAMILLQRKLCIFSAVIDTFLPDQQAGDETSQYEEAAEDNHNDGRAGDNFSE